jgi:hypothetical protein
VPLPTAGFQNVTTVTKPTVRGAVLLCDVCSGLRWVTCQSAIIELMLCTGSAHVAPHVLLVLTVCSLTNCNKSNKYGVLSCCVLCAAVCAGLPVRLLVPTGCPQKIVSHVTKPTSSGCCAAVYCVQRSALGDLSECQFQPVIRQCSLQGSNDLCGSSGSMSTGSASPKITETWIISEFCNAGAACQPHVDALHIYKQLADS